MDTPRFKRQKVAVACDPCRSRKVKCDGREPVCEPCFKRPGSNLACTWDSSASVRAVNAEIPSEHVKWLYDRIRLLEQQQNAQLPSHHHRLKPVVESGNPLLLEEAVHTVTRSKSHEPSIRQLTTSAPRNQESSRTLYRIESASQPSDPGSADFSKGGSPRQCPAGRGPESSTSECRSVHAIIGATRDEDSRDGFFGSTSAGTFMQSVKRIVEQKFSGAAYGTSSTIGRTHDHLPLLIPDRKSKCKPIDYVLPTRRKADRLMDLYWKYVHVLYPHLDQEQTQDEYDKLWKGVGDDSVSDEQSFLSLLNIIFALSSQIDTQIEFEDRERIATMYYDRAYELMDIRETGSIRAVQSFLLLGQYFQSTNEPHPCWVFVGLAIRTAQSLGLHQAETSKRASDVRTREILRRVWHGCILMDRVLSMTYGRPCSIGPKASMSVPLPQPMDQDYIPEEVARRYTTCGGEGHPSFVDFYVLSLKLYDILDDILFNCYTVETPTGSLPKDGSYDEYFGRPSTENNPAVFELERRLSTWEAGIPEHLRTRKRPAGSIGVEAILHRQAVVLRQRHIYVRLLLLRPILSTFITNEWHNEDQKSLFGGLLAHRILLQCAVVCVHVAQAAVDIIYMEEETLNEGPYFLSAWWYNVLFLYASATVLIAARLSPDVLNEIPEEKILDSWHKAVGILERYGAFGTSIQQIVTTLRLLFEAVPQQYSRSRQQKPMRQPEDNIPTSITENLQAVAMPLASWTSGDVTSSSVRSLGQEGTTDFPYPAGGSLDETLLSGSLLDFDNVFDPNDLSWLLTVPFNS